MAGTLVLDTVQGASLDAGPIGGTHVRTGLVKGIDVAGAADPLVLDKALNVVLSDSRVGGWRAAHPSSDGSALARVFVYPAGIDICRVQLVYEPNNFPVTSSYLLRDASYMQQWQGNVLPGTGAAFQTQWEDPSNSSNKVPSDYIPMSFPMPVSALGITAIVFGTPPAGLKLARGKVNNAPWQGLGKGYWLVTHLESDLAKFQGYYTYTATVSSRNTKDWSETGILRNRQTGRYVNVSQSAITELVGRPYSYGVMQGGTGGRAGKEGIIRVCPYPEVSLTTVLGF